MNIFAESRQHIEVLSTVVCSFQGSCLPFHTPCCSGHMTFWFCRRHSHVETIKINVIDKCSDIFRIHWLVSYDTLFLKKVPFVRWWMKMNVCDFLLIPGSLAFGWIMATVFTCHYIVAVKNTFDRFQRCLIYCQFVALSHSVGHIACSLIVIATDRCTYAAVWICSFI